MDAEGEFSCIPLRPHYFLKTIHIWPSVSEHSLSCKLLTFSAGNARVLLNNWAVSY